MPDFYHLAGLQRHLQLAVSLVPFVSVLVDTLALEAGLEVHSLNYIVAVDMNPAVVDAE